MEVAGLRYVDFHIGTVDAAFASSQEAPEDSLDIGFNSVMIGGTPCHSIHMAIDVLVARLRVMFFELKVFFNCHSLPML
jgi:hypothetical protein